MKNRILDRCVNCKLFVMFLAYRFFFKHKILTGTKVPKLIKLYNIYRFSKFHFRNTEGLPIPLDITIQTLIGLGLAMLSVLNIAGDFKEIRASVEMSAKSWETVSNRPSFYVYNHRGKAFSPYYEESISASPSGRRSLMDIPDRFLS